VEFQPWPRRTRQSEGFARCWVKKKDSEKVNQENARKKTREDIGKIAPLPATIEPQLCKVIDEPPSGESWAHEIKFDGYRMQMRVQRGKVALITRKQLDWNARFPEIAAAGKRFPDCMLDGEIVATDARGITSFAMLQEALSSGRTDELVFFVFDLLWAQGRDLRGEPLEIRKILLEEYLGAVNKDERIRYVEHFETGGKAMLTAACKAGLEGIISKKLTARYAGGRADSWTKAKCRAGQEVVIGGWWGDNKKLRSLLIGVHRGDKFVYLGRVGTGFNAQNSADVLEALKPLKQPKSPFDRAIDVPRQASINWVKPVRVAEVEFANITSDGLLRQAAFKGLRDDKDAKSVVLEPHPELAKGDAAVPAKSLAKAKTIETPRRKNGDPEVLGITITHPSKVLWPKSKTSREVTKRELAEYYEMAADRLLLELKGRPLSLVRAPDGIDGERFFQRHALMGAAGEINTIKVKGEDKPFLAVEKPRDLVALGQAGVLEIHPWGSKAGDPETPARLVFDLDPNPDVSFADVIAAAKEMKARIEDCGLVAFVKTTGGKGIHVVTPIKGTPRSPATWRDAKLFAHVLCQTIEKDDPERYTTNMAKKQRGGKIFLDYLRNDRMATAVAAWSPRAREGATVAMPLKWSELTAKLDPKTFTLANVKALLSRPDPWADMMKSAGSLEAASRKLAKL
jgi:bifunctional non-homologous end joining protein LigD